MLDTDTCIQMLRGRGRHIFERLQGIGSEPCAISTVVYGELALGAEKSVRPAIGWNAIALFCGSLLVLPFDLDAASDYARIRAYLEGIGKTIGPYDLQIAAHARSLHATLITHNLREFQRVPGLIVEDWTI